MMQRTANRAKAAPASVAAWFVLLACVLPAAPAGAAIRYAVSVADSEQHLFHITMRVPAVSGEVIVRLPAWNALYQVRDFASRISAVRAANARSQPLTIVKLDKQTWRVSGQGEVEVQYASFWDDAGPFSSQLNSGHAFLNLATILFYVPDRKAESVEIVFRDLAPSWHVATALNRAPGSKGAPGETYAASNYDALVDAPVELGPFEEWRLDGVEPPVRAVVHSDEPLSTASREKLLSTLRRIVSYETRLMGGAPYREYLFIYHLGAASSGAGGGMEHANSTAIFADSVHSIASVTAHEFFHLWNVKRIRPQSLEPPDDTHEQWTRALWFAEGVTSTYGAYTLVRTGLWSREQFYNDLAAQIAELESRPARRWKSVEEASLDAWLEKYPVYRKPDLSISYYNKGQILGVLLDILIRDATKNKAGLDDLLRAMNDHFARAGRFYRDSTDIRAEAEQIAGRSLQDFFSRYVAGTEELPCAEYLARAGLVLKEAGRAQAAFGFQVTQAPGDASLAAQVNAGSPAARAGVREGDTLLELNGSPFPRRAHAWLQEHRPGEVVHLRLRRGSEEREVSFALAEQQERFYEIEDAANATEEQRQIREGILRGVPALP